MSSKLKDIIAQWCLFTNSQCVYHEINQPKPTASYSQYDNYSSGKMYKTNFNVFIGFSTNYTIYSYTHSQQPILMNYQHLSPLEGFTLLHDHYHKRTFSFSKRNHWIALSIIWYRGGTVRSARFQ